MSGHWTLMDAAYAACGGDLSGGVPLQAEVDVPVRGVSIDARLLREGELFVALQGTRAHGLEFWQQAEAQGAAAIFVGEDAPLELLEHAQSSRLPLASFPVSGLELLGRLARGWRRQCGYTVVGITGSSGKTSTKDLLGAILAPHRRVLVSHANWNNEIGVPLTLLSASAGHDVVICEMGMRGLGQIDYLCSIAEPDVGVVTNAGSAHLELLGTVENIVRAKAELLRAVRDGGAGVAPHAQPELLAAGDTSRGEVLTFGDTTEADCTIVRVERTSAGIAGELTLAGQSFTFALPVHGAHQAQNLAAALCAASLVLDDQLDLVDLRELRPQLTVGRGDRHLLDGGVLLIDDSYNANPESMRAAIAELQAVDAPRRVAVLGSMAELGSGSPRLHRDLAEHVAAADVDELVVVGSDPLAAELADAYAAAAGTAAHRYDSPEEAHASCGQWLRPADAVLVKGSNAVGLTRLVQALLQSHRTA